MACQVGPTGLLRKCCDYSDDAKMTAIGGLWFNVEIDFGLGFHGVALFGENMPLSSLLSIIHPSLCP